MDFNDLDTYAAEALAEDAQAAAEAIKYAFIQPASAILDTSLCYRNTKF